MEGGIHQHAVSAPKTHHGYLYQMQLGSCKRNEHETVVEEVAQVPSSQQSHLAINNQNMKLAINSASIALKSSKFATIARNLHLLQASKSLARKPHQCLAQPIQTIKSAQLSETKTLNHKIVNLHKIP